jgi:sigma-B regulation protein RsbU (phosphoserine phosphatase)
VGDSTERQDAASRLGTGPEDGDPVLLQQVLDGLSVGVVVTDARGRVTRANSTALKTLGVLAAGPGAGAWNVLLEQLWPGNEETPARREPVLARVLAGETLRGLELCVQCASSSAPVWISVDLGPLRSRCGKTLGSVAVIRDVDAHRRDRQARDRLSRVVEETADVVVITDQEGIIDYVNPAFETVTGYSRDEAIGRTPRILRSGEHDGAFYGALWETILSNSPFRGTIVNRRKDGELFVSEQTITPMLDEENRITHFVSVAKDVTESRQAAAREREVALARTVQQRLYPRGFPRALDYDVWGRAFPVGSVGGDYFDFLELADGGLCLVIGDVSGHGIDAALYMSAARAYLRSAARTETDPRAVLGFVNRMLCGDLDSNRFVTMTVVCLEPGGRRMCYANAGHVPGLVLGSSGNPKLSLRGTGLPLGLFEDSSYDSASTDLDPGDMIALFTDGVTEAENAEGDLFDFERVATVLGASPESSAEGLVARLYRACNEFMAGRPFRDDFAAVVCKIAPGENRPPHDSITSRSPGRSPRLGGPGSPPR